MQQTQSTLLSRAECNALRGLAIMGIVLHNFCHWLPGVVHENEYKYGQDNVDWFFYAMAHPDGKWLLHVLSFFGHYGVPVFLFLSAYGLVRKYEQQLSATEVEGKVLLLNESQWGRMRLWFRSVCRFMRYHYLKLFKMMIVGFMLFLMVDNITPGAHKFAFQDVVAQLLMLNNLLPEPHHAIWPGPYWFFGLMLQLYLVYRVVLYRRHWGWTLGLMILCTAVQMFCGPQSDELNYLRYNFVGSMLPFGFGLLYARFDNLYTSRLYSLLFFAVSVMLVVNYSNGYISWFFVPLFVCSAAFTLVKICPGWLLGILEWLGGISAALFVIHPLLRKIFIPVSRRGDVYTGLLIYLLASIVMAYLLRELLKRLPNPKF